MDPGPSTGGNSAGHSTNPVANVHLSVAEILAMNTQQQMQPGNGSQDPMDQQGGLGYSGGGYINGNAHGNYGGHMQQQQQQLNLVNNTGNNNVNRGGFQAQAGMQSAVQGMSRMGMNHSAGNLGNNTGNNSLERYGANNAQMNQQGRSPLVPVPNQLRNHHQLNSQQTSLGQHNHRETASLHSNRNYFHSVPPREMTGLGEDGMNLKLKIIIVNETVTTECSTSLYHLVIIHIVMGFVLWEISPFDREELRVFMQAIEYTIVSTFILYRIVFVRAFQIPLKVELGQEAAGA
jgi:hypothetical protein